MAMALSACSRPAPGPALAPAPPASSVSPVAPTPGPGESQAERCEQAARRQEQARTALMAGELFRALRLLEQAETRCKDLVSRGQATRIEALAELGRAEAAELVDALERSAQSSGEDRRRARAAREVLSQRRASLPEEAQRPRWRALLDRALAAEERDLGEAQRLRERATEALEQATGERAVIELPTSTAAISVVAVAPDGERFASAAGREVTVHVRSSRSRVRRFKLPDFVTMLSFSPDSRLLAVRDTTHVRVLDLATGAESPRREAHFPGWARWSRDGAEVSFAGAEGVEVWAARSGGLVTSLPRPQLLPPRSIGQGLALSQDGQRLLAVERTGEVRLWYIHTAEWQVIPLPKSLELNDVALSPGGLVLATHEFDQAPSLWDLRTGRKLRQLTSTASVHGLRGLRWSPDGRTLAAVSGGLVHRWDAGSGRALPVVDTGTRQVDVMEWSAEGRSLVLVLDDGRLRWWDLSRGAFEEAVGGQVAKPSAVAWSRDGRSLATGSYDGRVRRWRWSEEGTMEVLGQHDAVVAAVDWSPEGDAVVSGDYAGTVQQWSTRTGQRLHSRRVAAELWSLGVSPDGRWLAVGAGDGGVHVGELTSGQWGPERSAHGRHRITSLAWSPDSRWLLTGSLAGSVIQWDPAGEAPLRTFWSSFPLSVLSVAVAPRGRTFAVGMSSDNLLVWELDRDEPRLTLHGRHGRDLQVAFAPDGSLLSHTTEHLVQQWDVSSGAPTLSFGEPGGAVNVLRVSSDGLVATSSEEEGAVRIWSLRERREVLALMTLAGDSGGVARSPGGEVALVGTPPQREAMARELACRVGTHLLPFAWCAGRFLRQELVPEAMGEALASRDPRL